MRLSVIVPLYNAELYIEKCIVALQNQGLNNNDYEIIIVNDGSIDRSLEKARILEKKYTNILVIDQKNEGVGSARNKGLELACGNYIHFVDADDFMEPESYTALLPYAEMHNLDLLFFKLRLLDKNLEAIRNELEIKANEKIITGKEAIANYKYHHSVCTSLIKKELIDANHLAFSECIWGEDILFITALLIKSERVSLVNQFYYNYIRYNQNAATCRKDDVHLSRMADSYLEVSRRLQCLIDMERVEVSEAWIDVIKNNINIFVYFGIIKYVIAKVSDRVLVNKLKEARKWGVYPIARIKYGINLRDKLIHRLVNNMILIRVCSWVYKLFK